MREVCFPDVLKYLFQVSEWSETQRSYLYVEACWFLTRYDKLKKVPGINGKTQMQKCVVQFHGCYMQPKGNKVQRRMDRDVVCWFWWWGLWGGFLPRAEETLNPYGDDENSRHNVENVGVERDEWVFTLGLSNKCPLVKEMRSIKPGTETQTAAELQAVLS